MDDMNEIINEFITEAMESLDKIEPLFVELEKKGHDADLVNEIFRSMHTIKGAAGFLGFQSIVDVAHSSENIMKKLRDRDISLSTELIDVILKSIDMLRLLLGHQQAKDGVEENISGLINDLESVLQKALEQPVPSPSATDEPAEEKSVDSKADISNGEEISSQKQVDENIHEKEVGHDNSLLQSGEAATAQRSLADEQASCELPATNKEIAKNLRVDVNRIDKVMDLAGEVVLVRNRLMNISHYFNQKYSDDPLTETLMESVSFLDRVTSDMQLAVMKIRMQPINKILGKFPRFVRDMSASLNKDVALHIKGEGTEVDKSVIENISDPLTHILRNAIDHGIESPDERSAKGKSPAGNILINIYQKGNQVVIDVSDDGKGLDTDRLKQKAIEKGILSMEEADKMTDDNASDIIFMPGFSTRDTANELSGRGVGMDVVKTNVSLLNGYVEVRSDRDRGTTFRICIPLTLAIIQALMVEVSGSKYAIPLSPIEETLQVSSAQIKNVNGQQVIVIRDRVCPLFELKNLLGENGNGNGKEDSEQKYLVVISMGEKRFCVAVDNLLGQEEVVIKALDGIDTSSTYVLGATITGDGKVVFILDVNSMSRNFFEIAKG